LPTVPGAAHLTGLREIAIVHHGEFRLTPNQNLVIANVEAGAREEIDALVQSHAAGPVSARNTAAPECTGVRGPAHLRPGNGGRPNATCRSLCKESRTCWPRTVSRTHPFICAFPDARTAARVRTSGEIALVGKAPGRYNLMLGADRRGQRLNTLYRGKHRRGCNPPSPRRAVCRLRRHARGR
jgi:sulfite reductase (NADPH) hemoprotein beta-component